MHHAFSGLLIRMIISGGLQPLESGNTAIRMQDCNCGIRRRWRQNLRFTLYGYWFRLIACMDQDMGI